MNNNCIFNNCNNLNQKNIELKRELSKIFGEFNNKINNSFYYYINKDTNKLKNLKYGDSKYKKEIGNELLIFYNDFYILMKDYFKNIRLYINCILKNCDAKTYYELLNKNKIFINHFNNEINDMFNIINSNKMIFINKTQQLKYEKKIIMIRKLIETNINKMLLIGKK
jgi:hypothetical protein